jgi:hypothetical protein
MSEQHSQKRGLVSEAQKTERARDAYAPIPPSNPVAGAFGKAERDTPTDQDTALQQSAKNSEREKREQ